MKNKAIGGDRQRGRSRGHAGRVWSPFQLWAIAIACFLLSPIAVHALIIAPTNRIDWTPGITVGSRVAPVVRTNIVPFTGDNTGASDVSGAINTAIAGLSANQVLYFSNGWYRCNSLISLNKSDVTLRGESTNAVIFSAGNNYLFRIGGGDSTSPAGVAIISGGEKGSTVLIVASTAGMAIGDMLRILTENPPTNEVTTISVHGYNHRINQTAIITDIAGNEVTISAPLVWSFNNNPIVQNVVTPKGRIGLETIRITQRDPTSPNDYGDGVFMFQISSLYDSWVTGCVFDFAFNFTTAMTDCAHILFRGNRIGEGSEAAPNHAGMILQNTSSCLIENNIFYNGLYPAFEIGTGFSGNAVFANFFTNNVADIVIHNTHPLMNVFEQNRMAYFQADGFFGSTSHHTLFRNALEGGQSSILFKRWTTYMQVVGNVLGITNTGMAYSSTNAGDPNSVVQIGYPNVGNANYSNATPNVSWEAPGYYHSDNAPIGQTHVTFTNNYPATNVLLGDFTFVPAPSAGVYSLVLLADGTYYRGFVQLSAGTTSNLLINVSQAVNSNWSFHLGGQGAYQQLQTGDKFTDLFHGNWDYADNEVKWDPGIADHAIPVSLIYTTSKPTWWGSVRWPAIGSDRTPKVARIPAENDYLNIPNFTNTASVVVSGGVVLLGGVTFQ